MGPAGGKNPAAGRRSDTVTAPALRGLSRFTATRGIPAGAEFLLDYDVIEAFCVAGLPGRATSTRGTYRSALYRLARPVHGEPGPRATPFAGAEAPAPYSPGERAELAAIAAAQRDPARRAGELMALRGSDVTRHGRHVAVHAGGPAARVVPVTAGYTGRAWELARRAGSDFVFRPGPADRRYKNFVTNFTRGLAADPAAPRLSLRRARSTFICGHMAAGAGLRELLAITGIGQAESLARYARHVDGAPPEAAFRAWDKRRPGC